jgi:hypothetical protein
MVYIGGDPAADVAGAAMIARTRAGRSPANVFRVVAATDTPDSGSQKTRGWRIEAPDRSSNVDAIVALMMALDRLENQPEPVKLLGWL